MSFVEWTHSPKYWAIQATSPSGQVTIMRSVQPWLQWPVPMQRQNWNSSIRLESRHKLYLQRMCPFKIAVGEISKNGQRKQTTLWRLSLVKNQLFKRRSEKRSSTSLEMQCSMTMSASAATAIMKQLLQYLLQRGTGAKTVQLTGPLNHDKK